MGAAEQRRAASAGCQEGTASVSAAARKRPSHTSSESTQGAVPGPVSGLGLPVGYRDLTRSTVGKRLES
eukprot:2922161-Rhodomonas_salina.1